jgi:predicted PurR-regulated permease PerM
MPRRYRRDVRDLWDAFAFSLSRYLSGLGLVAIIQGALSAIALFFLGVPYALLLGTWVSITSIIPYLGAFLGAIPAVLLALFESPTTALLTALAFLLIQQLEGNVLTPRIQGQTLRVPSILIFLAVIAGGEIAGLLGVIFAVPTVAVLRVLFDFFRVRLRTRSQ